MRFLDDARAVFKSFVWSGFGGQSGSSFGVRRRHNVLFWDSPGTAVDYVQAAGDLWRNSVVGICANWWMLSVPEAVAVVRRDDGNGEYTDLDDHPASLLLRSPAPPLWTRQRMFGAVILSLLTDGNAYIVKVRNNRGVPAQLQWVPHFQMEPRWPSDAGGTTVPISHYEQYVDGTWYRREVEDVIHIRFGVDPDNVRKGLSPLKQQLRQVYADNEYSSVIASLMANSLMTPFVVSPKDSLSGAALDETASQQLRRAIMARTTGDKRGEPLVIGSPMELTRLGISPDEMAVETLTNQWTSRICAAMMIDPMVVGLPSDSNTHYDNRIQAERGAWYNGILPVLSLIAGDLTQQLLMPEYHPSPDLSIVFDTSQVRALQNDVDAQYKRLVLAAGGPILTPNEARGMLDVDPIDGGDDLRASSTGAPLTVPSEEQPVAQKGGTYADPYSMTEDEGSEDWARKLVTEITTLAEASADGARD